MLRCIPLYLLLPMILWANTHVEVHSPYLLLLDLVIPKTLKLAMCSGSPAQISIVGGGLDLVIHTLVGVIKED